MQLILAFDRDLEVMYMQKLLGIHWRLDFIRDQAFNKSYTFYTVCFHERALANWFTGS